MKKTIWLALCGPLITGATLAISAPVSAQTGCPVGQYLTEGRRGSDDVRCLQESLNNQGFNSGPVDGWFGPVTEGAVIAYQQAKGLVVDGEVGRQTGGSLGIWSAEARQAAAAPAQRSSGSSGGSSGGSGGGSSGGSGVWDRMAQCESGGNWSISTGNGYYGGLQFTLTAWQAAGGSGNPANASREEQIRRGQILQDMVGWGAWPACARRLGLR